MGAFDFALPLVGDTGVERVALDFDIDLSHTLWMTMRKNEYEPSHYFSLSLLHALRDAVRLISVSGMNWHHHGKILPIQYAVMQSDHPEYFNLGGDLKHFRQCILEQDRNALYQYSKFCLDTLYEWASCTQQKMTTIALVQGKALGGGFEAALGADFILAEEHSTFGFPEIMFGLFPCTGGMSLLTRRVGVYQAERMMTNGKTYSAPELLEMGVIDEICSTGEGRFATEKFIANHAKRRVPRLMLQRGRHRIAPLDYLELAAVVEEWVDTAMTLGEEELRTMDLLIMMQQVVKTAPSHKLVLGTNPNKE